MNKPELLVPAGNLENAETALRYGADAIYQGLEGFSLRSGKKAEVSFEDIRQISSLAHSIGKKYYLAINIFAHNEDIHSLEQLMPDLKKLDVDAFILSDFGIISLFKKHIPLATIHLSTQSNTLNYASVDFWHEQGIARVIMAREVSLIEIAELKKHNPKMDLEMFVHGAMCMAYSGRCNLSLYFLGRDANKGKCAHPCRWKYTLVEKSEDKIIEIDEDERGAYLLNSTDLNLSRFIPDLVKAGVESFKIEGRNKTSYYIANVARVYRHLIDLAVSGKTAPIKIYQELEKISHREYSHGFLNKDSQLYNFDSSEYTKTKKMVGIVESTKKGSLVINVRDKIQLHDKLDIIFPEIDDDQSVQVSSIYDEVKGKELEAAHNGYQVSVPFDTDIVAQKGLIIRKDNI